MKHSRSNNGIKAHNGRNSGVFRVLISMGFLIFCGHMLFSQSISDTSLPVYIQDGEIKYTPDSLTGDRVPDFSYCGYEASESEIPEIPARLVIPPVEGDATKMIQYAIDEISSFPQDKNGFRGTILLSEGEYEIGGSLRIHSSGVVLRGKGADGQTVLRGTGVERIGMIRVEGEADRKMISSTRVTEPYVPVNATAFRVENPDDLKPGDQIIILRPSTREWIEKLGTATFGGGISALGWKPGEVDLQFDRRITRVNGRRITIDVPLTTSLDSAFGGGYVLKYEWPGRIDHIGIENMTLMSSPDPENPKDENHRWNAVNIAHAEDVWIRQVNFKNFAGSAVFINESVKRVTVEDCISLAPVSEAGGQRRQTFFTRGQQTLFQRCYSQEGYHDFSVGYATPGPNAFVQCVSDGSLNFSGTTGRWASGVLFDVMSIDGNAIRAGNRWEDGRGAGWSGANCFFWNCSASLIECDSPPTAQNWSYGAWSRFKGSGFWAESNNHLSPRSFYYAQLSQRLGRDLSGRAAVLGMGSKGATSPGIELAQKLTGEASQPLIGMKEWIQQASVRNPIGTDHHGAERVKFPIEQAQRDNEKRSVFIQKINGWLTADSAVLTGKIQNVPWWTGGVEGKALEQARERMAVTRFVPGRRGAGLTDDLRGVVDSMKSLRIAALSQNYGLWYDRRRDDHERVRRMNGEVWPPFYELPFARSGQGVAWDGLSKYDLTRYNDWYWDRLERFAALAEKEGLMLLHQNYFQHNIIEAGAHYADFPWRTANNINQTGFVEPVRYNGDKRIFYAEQFYDTDHPVRKSLHEQYIRKALKSFKEYTSVIQFTSEEYTGPLHFVEFWLETIREWKKHEQSKNFIGLGATKDVQDAILENKMYSELVDVIDIKYWFYQKDGELYAPEGGKNLAPRQWARILKPRGMAFDQVYRAVREYRIKYPEKAVLFSANGSENFGWAVFFGGGSLAVLPEKTSSSFLKAAASMHPSGDGESYLLTGRDGLIRYVQDVSAELDLRDFSGRMEARFINEKTGEIIGERIEIEAGKKVKISMPEETQIIWIVRSGQK